MEHRGKKKSGASVTLYKHLITDNKDITITQHDNTGNVVENSYECSKRLSKTRLCGQSHHLQKISTTLAPS